MPGTVEAGNDSLLHVLQALGQFLIGQVGLKITVIVKENHFRGINEFKSQIIGNDNTVQVLASGSRIIPSCLCQEVLLYPFKFVVQVQV